MTKGPSAVILRVQPNMLGRVCVVSLFSATRSLAFPTPAARGPVGFPLVSVPRSDYNGVFYRDTSLMPVMSRWNEATRADLIYCLAAELDCANALGYRHEGAFRDRSFDLQEATTVASDAVVQDGTQGMLPISFLPFHFTSSSIPYTPVHAGAQRLRTCISFGATAPSIPPPTLLSSNLLALCPFQYGEAGKRAMSTVVQYYEPRYRHDIVAPRSDEIQ